MATTPKTGPEDLLQAATYGGPGWSTRPITHAGDVEIGQIWRRCGVRSEVAPLKQVLLSWPGPELRFPEDPDYWLMLERPDLSALQAQTRALADRYQALGVQVHLIRPSAPPPPNFLFQRDLFFTTPEGVVLARPASPRRAGEVRFVAEALAALGVPILMTPRGRALFEGADAFWVSGEEVLVGVGVRTNDAAFDQLSGLLRDMGVRATKLAMPKGIQHLMGVMHFADRDLVVAREDRLTDEMEGALTERGFQILRLPAGDEVSRKGAMNFVAIGPRHLLLPSDCPKARARYRHHGVRLEEVEVGEYLKAAGGPGCLTGILEREV